MNTQNNTRRRQQFSKAFESLEERRLMANFAVTSVNDSGAGSLRQAILSANAALGADTITFNIADDLKRIIPSSPLPNITGPITIDGTSQPGYAGTPIVNIAGFNVADMNGLTFSAGSNGSVVKGMTISSMKRQNLQDASKGNGIILETGSQNITIENNLLGGAAGNFGSGVLVRSHNNTIRNNLATGNGEGVTLEGFGAYGNVVSGISSGDLGNFRYGVAILGGASNNTIGGTTSDARNYLARNDVADVFIGGTAATGLPANNRVLGNWIGIGNNGTAGVSIGANVLVRGATNTQIGGSDPGEGNAITHSLDSNIRLEGANTVGTVIRGNLIGMDATGVALTDPAASKTKYGVLVTDGAGATIGGTAVADRNYIASATQSGISLSASGNVSVKGNVIGLNPAGNAVGMLGAGISLSSAIGGQVVGGSAPGEGNIVTNANTLISAVDTVNPVITGNQLGMNFDGTAAAGIALTGIYAPNGGAILNNRIANTTSFAIDVQDATVKGNWVGLNAAGTAGISVGQGIRTGANSVIGGTTAQDRNVIGKVQGYAIESQETSGAVIQGNWIGTNATNTAPFTNLGGTIGVITDMSSNVTIGGTAPGAGNLITRMNTGISVSTGEAVKVEGNTITGNGAGVRYTGTANSILGGTTAAAGNVISSNTKGVIVDSTAGNVTIRRNSIFNNSSAAIDLGNDGLTANDAGDADTGANTRQNFPLLLSADSNSGTNTTVGGLLTTSPGTALIVDYYSSDDATSAKTWLGSQTVITDAGGAAVLNVTLPFVAGDKFITATATNLNNAPHGNTSEVGPGVQVAGPIDTSTPAVTNSVFEFETAQQVKLTFSQELTAGMIANSDLQMKNTTTNTTFTPSSFTYDAASKSVTFKFNNALTNGNYTWTLGSGAVSNLAGNASAVAHQGSSFVKAGDFNRDRTVNFSDLVILAQNYNQTGKTFSQGNADYSANGSVNFSDLVILAQNYNTSLAAAPAPIVGTDSETPERVAKGVLA